MMRAMRVDAVNEPKFSGVGCRILTKMEFVKLWKT
jgi:hypothetical protein